VPVDLLVDPLAGTGLPRHYADPPGPAPATAPTERDRRLLALAQQATVDRAVEVVLDDDAINALAGTPSTDEPRPRLLPHANLTVEVHAADRGGLAAGAFTLAVVGASRSALATNGRFLDVVAAADRRRMSQEFQQLPVGVTDALPAQLGLAPAHLRTENVVRSARLLPAMIRLAEFGAGSVDEIAVEDLAVAADAGRLYLLSLSQRRVVEPLLTNAAARHAMPPLARFLAELPHATSTPVVLFDWGVANCLPFLPRVRYGRSILSAARWRIPLTAFPLGGSDRDWTALDRLRDRLRLPSTVMVGSGDRRLRLDLDDPMHRAVLRAHVAAAVEPVMVTEAATPADYGWLDGRAHEVVIPVASTLTPAPLPAVLVGGRPVKSVDRASVVLPGSAVLYAKLYAHPEVFDHLLVDQLPELLAAWEQPPTWWFVRYQDPAPHLRIRLTGLADYGLAANRVGSWATALRRRGMVADLVLDTYHPETGRYGDGPAMAAAQALFAADSRAVVAQLAAQAGDRSLDSSVLTAVSLLELASAVAGTPEAGRR